MRHRSYLYEDDIEGAQPFVHLVKQMGGIGKIGPRKFRNGDLVILGKSKPRKVVHVSKTSVSLMPTRKVPKRGMAPFRGFAGQTELFWDSVNKEYYLQGKMGKVRGTFSPGEVRVTAGR